MRPPDLTRLLQIAASVETYAPNAHEVLVKVRSVPMKQSGVFSRMRSVTRLDLLPVCRHNRTGVWPHHG